MKRSTRWDRGPTNNSLNAFQKKFKIVNKVVERKNNIINLPRGIHSKALLLKEKKMIGEATSRRMTKILECVSFLNNEFMTDIIQ